MISFDEAIAIIRSAAHPLGAETVTLDRAAGRVLAAPVVAGIDSPRADVSAMDGYAVRDADLQAFPVSLTVRGQSCPGSGWQGTVEPGTCVRIFTGAPLPAGADLIVIQEQVRREGDRAIIDAPPGTAAWVRAQGSDFQAGDELEVDFRIECWLTPQQYTLTVATQSSDGSSHDWLDDAIAFDVVDTRVAAGVANLRAQVAWRVSR